MQEDNSLQKVWQGVAIDQYSVPSAKQPNRFLKRFGEKIEPQGQPVSFFPKEPGPHFIQGKISQFGGKVDRGVSPHEVSALTGEKLRNVNADSDYYLAMRFNYGNKPGEGREFFRNRRFLIVNPKTMEGVVARAIDWGPHPSTQRIIDTSPSVMKKLNLKTDDPVWVSFAENNAALGPVAQTKPLNPKSMAAGGI